MSRDENRGEKVVRNARVIKLTRIRWRTASSDDVKTDRHAPHSPAAASEPEKPPTSVTQQAPTPLPRRDPDPAARPRRLAPRAQRPDDQVLNRVVRALRRL